MAEYFTQTCAVCGKEIVTHGAKNWGYKIKEPKGPYKFFCSYKCQRKYEKDHPEKKVDVIAKAAAEEAKKPKKMPTERGCIARSLIDVIRAGEDPIKYLQKQGYKNPYEAYSSVRHYCETNEPHLTEVLKPLKELRKAEVQKVDKVPDIEQLEEQVAEVLNAEVKPIGSTFRYQVTGIETEFGRFDLIEGQKMITFTYENEEITVTAKDWRKMAEHLPQILDMLLGVEE